MTCSVAQAIKDRWAEAATSFGIFNIPSTDGLDNRFYQDGSAPILPPPPYVVLGDTGGRSSSRDSEAETHVWVYQLRIHVPSREQKDIALSGVPKLYDCGTTGWLPVTDEGKVLDVRVSRSSSARMTDGHWLAVVTLAVTVSVSRS